MKIQSHYLKSDYDSAVVVPCYKEAKRLDVNKYINSLGQFSSKVFLVDDGSPDNTFDILKKLEKYAPDRFIAIKSLENNGKAEAVRRGMNEALDKHFKNIGFLDADLAVGFDEIPDFLKAMDSSEDINTVIGVRTRLAGHDIDRSLPKYLVQRTIAKMGSLLINKDVIDTQCGAKMFKSEILAQTIKEKFHVNWIFDQELLTRISRLPQNHAKNWLFEYPVKRWKEFGDTHVKPKAYVESLLDYFKLLKQYGLRK